MNLKIENLSKNGFLFLWILNTQMNMAYEIMEKWVNYNKIYYLFIYKLGVRSGRLNSVGKIKR